MGLVVHPDFAQSRRFTTCQTHAEGGRPVDVRLVTWTLSADGARGQPGHRPADRRAADEPVRPALRLPAHARRGRRAAGRHRRHRARQPAAGPQLARREGAARRPGHRPARRATRSRRRTRAALVSHLRAPQRPGRGRAARHDGAVYTAEHGPTTDDEVNLLRARRQLRLGPGPGRHRRRLRRVGPDDRPGAASRTPCPRPGARAARSEAVAGAAFVSGPQWGDLDGTLAVAALRGQKLLLMTIGADGAVTSVAVPAPLDDTFGRLRAVRTGPGRRAVRQHLERRRRQGAADRPRLNARSAARTERAPSPPRPRGPSAARWSPARRAAGGSPRRSPRRPGRTPRRWPATACGPAELAHVLQRGLVHLGVRGRRLEVVQRADVAAHATTVALERVTGGVSIPTE